MIKIESVNNDIICFWREGKQICSSRHTFEPYFYIRISELNKLNSISEYIIRHETADASGKPYVSLYGDILTKVIVRHPGCIPMVRDIFEGRGFESDVFYHQRCAIDHLNFKQSEMRIAYIDFEMEFGDKAPTPFPDSTAQNKFEIMSFYDNYDHKMYVFYLGSIINSDNVRKIITNKLQGKISMEFKIEYRNFSDEKKMIEQFIAQMNELDFDIYSAWNLSNFDLPYLINRCNRLGITPLLGRESFIGINAVPAEAGEFENRIFGRSSADLYTIYKGITYGERESHKLDFIANYELGVGKLEFDINKQDEYVAYNIIDVLLCVAIDNRLKLIKFMDSIRIKAKCNFEDAVNKFKFNRSRIDDLLKLIFCNRKYALPTVNKENVKQPYTGAFIKKFCKPGTYNNVVVYDFSGLYPNVMISCNVSPEVLCSPEEDDCIITPGNAWQRLFSEGYE